MSGNIVKMGLVVTLLLVLVGGTVYIIARPADARAAYAEVGNARRGGGRGESAVASSDAGDGEAGYGMEAGSGYGQGNGREDLAAGQGGRFQGTQQNGGEAELDLRDGQDWGQGQGAQSNSLWNGAETPAWETIAGTVVESGSEILVRAADGAEILVGLGQEFYRDEQGFSIAVGDEVRVEGYYEDGEFKAGTVENLGTGETITLRDATGRPMWSGRGNGQNRS